jgi:LPXTG-motif cell wall-anchored protein
MNFYTLKAALYLFLSLGSFLFLMSYTLPNGKELPSEIRILLDKAEDQRCAADYAGAIASLEAAQRSYQAKDLILEALELYDKILWIAIDTDFDDAAFLQRYRRAEKEINAHLKQYPQLKAILYLAILQKTWVDDNFERAEKTYQELQAHLKQYPNWDYEAAAASHMANIYAYCTWEASKCGEFAELSINLVKKNTNNLVEKDKHLYRLYPYYMYYNYDNTGSVELYGKGDEEAGLKAYNNALNNLGQQKEPDSLHYSNTLIKVGDIYAFREEEDKAIEYFENALTYIPLRMKLSIAECQESIGGAYITQAKDEQAIFHYSKSIKKLNEIEPQTDYIQELYVDIYRSMATSYTKLKEYNNAKLYLGKIAEFPAKADFKPSWTWATWGFLYEYTKEYKKAIEAHERSIVEYRKEKIPLGSAYWNLGNIANDMGDYKLATSYFHQSIVEHLPHWSVADFTKHPRFEDIPYKNNIVDNLADKLYSYYQYVDRNNLWNEHGESLQELADLTVACFDEVRNSFDRESSKRSLLETAYFTYEQAISTYLELYEQSGDKNYLIKAFEFAEQSKSVLLEDALKEKKAISFGGVPDSLIQQETLFSQQISMHKQDLYLAEKSKNKAAVQLSKKALFQVRQKQDALAQYLEKEYPKYYELKYSKKQISLDAIQKTLPEGTCIIEYFEGYNNIIGFSITKNTLEYIKIPRKKECSKSLENFRKMMGSGSFAVNNPTAAYSNYIEQAYPFYQEYVDRLIPENIERLIIVPDGLLNLIAFEALLTEQPVFDRKQLTQFNKLPYLLNRYTVSYNYSATMWMDQFSKNSSSTNYDLLAMAAVYNPNTTKDLDSTMNNRMYQLRKGLAPIPGTVEEVNLLQEYFGGAFYNGNEANEHRFKKEAPKYGILHLAMHGIVDDENPEFSSMAFTEDGRGLEDNFLHSNEIKQLDLQANLVVLSACETGFGKYEHGEGVVSLGRSFMYAGAPSVVMTLWNINDYSSIFITKSFYENLQKGLPKDKALQKAKQAYLKSVSGELSHPAFWAAFVQLGDYKPINVANKSSINWYLGGGLSLLLLLGGLFFLRKKNEV